MPDNYIQSYGNSTYGLTLSPQVTSKPVQPAKELIATRAVQTKVGWLGQVLIDSEIVKESSVHESAEAAQKWANEFVVARIRKLFS